MIDIRASTLICQLADHFLDQKTAPVISEDFRNITTHGVIFTLNCSTSDYTEEKNYHVNKQIYFLFTRRTSVFVAVAPEGVHYYSWEEIPLELWENTSNHDTCWRSDGTDSPLSKLYFNMCDEVNSMREQDGLERKAPVELSHFNNFSHRLVRHVDVTTTDDADSHNPSYFKKIVEIKARGREE